MRRLPVTEATHPRGKDLERLPAGRLLARLHVGDQEAVRAVGRALPALSRLTQQAVVALRSGGRLVYAGAGTSGRLGALDAAECPPTFGIAPSRVIALVAGGARALRRSAEGAEDDVAAGSAAAARLRLGPKDLVVGISASGRTPFVTGALAEARLRGARTALLTSNPEAPVRGGLRVVLDTGPELVAGSTRMKAGTAAKMALGLLSTGAFVALGAVRGGRMIALRPTNAKLRDRAVRNVMALANVSAADARRRLAATGWRVGEAVDAVDAGGAEAAPGAKARPLEVVSSAARRHGRGGPRRPSKRQTRS